MRRILRIVSSRKLAIVLLVLTIILSLVGTTVLDEDQLGEYAKSWWFISVIIFLLTATVVCTVQRVIGVIDRKGLNEKPSNNFDSKIITNKDIFAGFSTLDIELRKYKYQTTFKKDNSNTFLIKGIKGQFGFWGSIIFHISFLVIGFGVIFSLAFKFSGDFMLVEGQTFNDYQAGYQNTETGIFYKSNHGQYQLNFKNFEPRVSNNKKIQSAEEYSEDYISTVAIIDNYQTVKEVQLGVNQKVKYKGFTINPDYYGHGYAPKLKITRIRGDSGENLAQETVVDSYLVLNTDLHRSYDEIAEVMSEVTYGDEVELPDLNWKLKVNFFPSKPKDGEKIVEASPFAKDSFLSIEITDLESQKVVYQGVVDLKKAVEIGSYKLEFTEVENWQRFLVRKDRGQGIVYLGFFIGIVGLILRFTQHQRMVLGLIQVEDGQTVIYLKEILENKSLQKPQLDEVLTSLGGD